MTSQNSIIVGAGFSWTGLQPSICPLTAAPPRRFRIVAGTLRQKSLAIGQLHAKRSHRPISGTAGLQAFTVTSVHPLPTSVRGTIGGMAQRANPVFATGALGISVLLLGAALVAAPRPHLRARDGRRTGRLPARRRRDGVPALDRGRWLGCTPVSSSIRV